MKFVLLILANAEEITLEFCRKIKSAAQQGIQQPLGKGDILRARLIEMQKMIHNMWITPDGKAQFVFDSYLF